MRIDMTDLAEKVKEAVHTGELSRRDALKILAFASTGMLSLHADENGTEANTSVAKPKASTNAHVVIVGGGAGGIAVAARLKRAIDNPKITIIEPSTKHCYQPGQTLVGGGIWELGDLYKDEADVMPSGVTWIQDKVVEFKPDNNIVVTEKGQQVSYDYLVVAAGLQYNFDQIKGLSADMIGQNGIHSIYLPEKAPAMWEAMQNFKGGTALFTNPSTPIKCGGAPQKIMYLTEDYLRSEGNRDKATIRFVTAGGRYFGIPIYHHAVEGFVREKGIETAWKHNLVEIRAAEKIAVFEKTTTVKKFDELLGEEIEVEQKTPVEMKYDLIHITPPMSPVEAVKNSPLANAKGWVWVDELTLQSKRYPNVFGIGDNIGTPFGKTGGSVRKQAPVLVANIVALMEGKEMTAKYNGYTVCPLITRRGRIMMAEFGYDAEQVALKEPITKAMPMPSFPLDPAQERWIWWLLKVYLLKPMYWYGMLKGLA